MIAKLVNNQNIICIAYDQMSNVDVYMFTLGYQKFERIHAWEFEGYCKSLTFMGNDDVMLIGVGQRILYVELHPMTAQVNDTGIDDEELKYPYSMAMVGGALYVFFKERSDQKNMRIREYRSCRVGTTTTTSTTTSLKRKQT